MIGESGDNLAFVFIISPDYEFAIGPDAFRRCHDAIAEAVEYNLLFSHVIACSGAMRWPGSFWREASVLNHVRI